MEHNRYRKVEIAVTTTIITLLVITAGYWMYAAFNGLLGTGRGL